MKSNKVKNIWVGKEDLTKDPTFVKKSKEEFFKDPITEHMARQDERNSLSSNRRDFLKFMGFSLGAATIAACETPVRRAIPYVDKPDTIVPGVPTYYASTFVQGSDICPILVKTREGRPIKIEGNKLSEVTSGGTSARAQASVLDLYDNNRFTAPMMREGDEMKKVDWETALDKAKSQLAENGKVYVVSNSIASPTLRNTIQQFTGKYSDVQHVTYDPHSSAALLDAHQQTFGFRGIPAYKFDQAEVIVSIEADFLGTWISPVEYAKDFAKGRKIDGKSKRSMSRLYVMESAMSLTGSNADHRIITKPSHMSAALVHLFNAVAKGLGMVTFNFRHKLTDNKQVKQLDLLAEDLINAKRSGKRSLVVCGTNNLGEQKLALAINDLLGNIGSTIDSSKINVSRQGDDKSVQNMLNDLKAGRVSGLIFVDGANPVYDMPFGKELAEAMKQVGMKLALQSKPTETSSYCDLILPTNHYLEAWSDAQMYNDELLLVQPTIEPLGDTKTTAEIIARLAGETFTNKDERPDYQLLKSNFGSVASGAFDAAIHDGIAKANGNHKLSNMELDMTSIANYLQEPGGGGDEVKFYETVNIGAGDYASNPWLQEMPDPLYRTVWDNFVTVPLAWDGARTIANEQGWESGDRVNVNMNGQEVEVTVLDQFGVKPGIHGMAMGYGHTGAGPAANGVGVNAASYFSTDKHDYMQYWAPITFGEKVGHDDTFASVQYHHTYGIKDTDPNTGEKLNVDEQSIATIATGYQGALTDRSVMYYSDLHHLEEDLEHLKEKRAEAQHLNSRQLYTGHDELYDMGHKWGLSIDLNSCIGCGACQVACISENNVPVVGKAEVARHHEMTWLRIDRYFFGDIESPNAVYQPMMCQHCDNAPCENVCPVGATSHSQEGLNHMAYNRCIGTRYCANNCPYKVRRFNWLDYTTADLFAKNENNPLPNETDIPYYADDTVRMVLNPDVTVRSRGVMEKCSMCIQRIQSAKLEAKVEARPLQDGDVQTACVSACPTQAIVFGDQNDADAQINKRNSDDLNFIVLEEVNTRSNVGYLMKVTNKNQKIEDVDA